MTTQRKHAVVVGGSVAGLLAARVLTDHYSRVTLLERDVFPDTAEPRKGVPQGRHTHGLLSRGREILEEFFPGFTAELAAQGAVVADLPRDTRWHLGGGYFAQAPMATGLITLLASRPKLEEHLRRRLLALPNSGAIEGCTVLGLEASPDQPHIVGVRLRHDLADLDMVIGADLVVDATGRGSRMPAWLQSLGYSAPKEERVEVKIGYASQLYRRTTSLPTGATAVVGSSEPGANRSGLYVPIEGDRWIVNVLP